MVWPILISLSVTPGAFCAAAGIAIAPPSSKQPSKIRSIPRPPLVSSDVSTIPLYRCDAIGPSAAHRNDPERSRARPRPDAIDVTGRAVVWAHRIGRVTQANS
jgi:hypothetical protein